MKRTLTILLAVLMCSAAGARDYSAEYLDTVTVKKVKTINDYVTVGVNYGVTLSEMYFNPDYSQDFIFNPNYISVMFTKYCKMFGFMPYFGIEAGFSYGHQGFKMSQDPDSQYLNVLQFGTIGNVVNVLEETMTVVKVPMRAKFHVDIYPFRLQANVGVYAGYRTSVERTSANTPSDPSMLVNFQSYENRFDYGMEGGAGFAFLLDPVEIHFGALVGWSWNSIYEPDSRPLATAKYYYRYAYPLDLMITAGIHFQLSKRTGKTSAQLKAEARKEVYKDLEKAAEAAAASEEKAAAETVEPAAPAVPSSSAAPAEIKDELKEEITLPNEKDKSTDR